MTKALAAFLLAALLALGGVGVIAKRQAAQLGELRTANNGLTEALDRAEAQRKRDAATLVARARENAATARKFEQAQEALYTALQRNKSWSEADVPPEVRDALLRDSERSNYAPD